MNPLLKPEEIEKVFWKDIIYEIVSNMNLWDIDIEEVARIYSRKIEEMKELNFKIPANLIIICAVLLRMKSELLTFTDENKNKHDEIENDNFNEDTNINDNLNNITDEIEISVVPKRILKGKISVEELISTIEEILKIPDKKIIKKREEKMKERQIIEFHIDDDIKIVVERIYNKIVELMSERSNKEAIKFSEISNNTDKKNFIKDFIAVLFLFNAKKIDVVQNENYGEIYLKIC